ncbi:exopolysaccharide biosynthesis protein [Limimaricola pyoseonensis]|uniref:Chromosome partitioning ATPase, Mrp family, contains Fe-S cluster n=1 Tax=Limimaricola pyoseonensis TaxID=521013 RepID=A0A1G7K231_9RHOB|nr:exopolysaccharide biosynthesis protein [Limimaricola pyoseonensis]SDF31187.1 Chromosome partitioning ATPase, Mrp family, contains Fe-S cluster [Limimaricola pyoseonensis]
MAKRSGRDGRRRLGAGARQEMLARIAAAGGLRARRPAPSAGPDPAAAALREAVLDLQAARLPQLHDMWDSLPTLTVDAARLERNLVIAAARRDPAHAAFDVLRTRLLRALRDNGWHRVAVTSPTDGCGKTFTAANLAVSLSRYEGCRTLLLDLDLRSPGLAPTLGVAAPGPISDWLRGAEPLEAHLRRIGPNPLGIGGLGVALNDRAESFPAELLRDPATGAALAAMQAALSPDVVLYDLPPALAHDDVAAFRDQYDGVLMVVGGGRNSAEQIREAVRRIGDDKPVLGIILNRAEEERASGAA